MSSSSSSDDLVTGAAGVTTDDQTDATKRRQQGEFVRGVSTARHWIQQDSNSMYPVANNRYHLYVGYNCPWCHRVLIARNLMGLQDVITVDVCFPNRSSPGETPLGDGLWKFEPSGQVGINGLHVSLASCTADTVLGKKYIKEIYESCGIFNQTSVPILFDKQTKTIVNNESAEIVRMLGTVFQSVPTLQSPATFSLYPPESQSQIDELNDWIYKDVANGSYKAGFSSNQKVYEMAYRKFFAALQRLDAMLAQSNFLVPGHDDHPTEADVRLFPPLFRLDAVYYSRFKLNQAYLWEYPNLWRWMGRMMQLPGMADVSNREYLQHCKQGYFGRTGNGTVPIGPPNYPECYLKPHPLSHPSSSSVSSSLQTTTVLKTESHQPTTT